MKKALVQLAAPLTLLAIILIVDAIFWPSFFSVRWFEGHLVGSLVDVANRAAPVMILSAGMVLVIATGGVDLSVGAVMAIAGSVSAFVIAGAEKKTGAPPATVQALFAGLLAGLFGGLVNGILVSVVKIQPIIATLLLMVAGRGIAQLISDGQIVTFQDPTFAAIGAGSKFLLPNPVWIALAMVLVVSLVTRRTSFGLFLESVGANTVASRLSGINVTFVKTLAYLVSGFCAALAGIVMTADIRAADANNLGLYYELDAILAVAIGGTSLNGGKFSVAGAVIGAILMQTLTTTVTSWGIDRSTTLILKAVLVVTVCILQSPKLREKWNSRKKEVAA
jgi:galactofuranose transport system permease protein